MKTPWIGIGLFTLCLVGCQNPGILSRSPRGLSDRSGDRSADTVGSQSEDSRSRRADSASPGDRGSGSRRSGSPTVGDEVQQAGYGNSAADSPTITAHLKRAYQFEHQGDWEQAQAGYWQVIKERPDHPEAHHRLAVLADKTGNYTTAERHYRLALRGKSNDAVLLSDLGYSYFLQRRFQESERVLLKAASLSNPPYAGALSNLGLVYATRGDYDRALATFRKMGTEQQAQAKMAVLFPNGRPATAPNGRPIPNTLDVPNTAQLNVNPSPRQDNPNSEFGPGVQDLFSRMQQERERAELARVERDRSRNQVANNSPDSAPPFPNASMSNAPRFDSNRSSPGVSLAAPNNSGEQQSPFFDPASSRASIDSPVIGMTSTSNPLEATSPHSLDRTSDDPPPSVNPLDSMEAWPPPSETVESPFLEAETHPPAPGRIQQAHAVATSTPGANGSNGNGPVSLNDSSVPQEGGVQTADYSEASQVNQTAAIVGLDAGFGGLFPVIRGAEPESVTTTARRYPSHAPNSGYRRHTYVQPIESRTETAVDQPAKPHPLRTANETNRQTPSMRISPASVHRGNADRSNNAAIDPNAATLEAPRAEQDLEVYHQMVREHDTEYQRLIRQLDRERQLPRVNDVGGFSRP